MNISWWFTVILQVASAQGILFAILVSSHLVELSSPSFQVTESAAYWLTAYYIASGASARQISH